MRDSYRLGGAGVAALATLAFAPPTQAAPAYSFGVACQEDFSNLDPLWEACDAVSEFSTQMTGFATRNFSRSSLSGSPGVRFLEKNNDVSSKVESSDIVLVATHTGSNGTWNGRSVVQIAGKAWNGDESNSERAVSANMRLGDSGSWGKGLSVLAFVGGCATTPWNPRSPGDGISAPYYGVLGTFWDRWGDTFRGGLRLILGNWDANFSTIYGGFGTRFGQYVRNNLNLADAWRRADWETNQATDTSVGAAGTDNSDCWSRMHSMALWNQEGFTRRRDSNVKWLCSWYWTNDSLGDIQR